MGEVRAFFMARCGRAFGFRFKDWTDYTITDQIIGVGDGEETDFQLIKSYVSRSPDGSTWSFDRLISKVAWGSLNEVTVAGETYHLRGAPGWDGQGGAFSLDHNNGIISFDAPPTGDIVVPYSEFHVPVRFDTDHFNVTFVDWNYTSVGLPLVEVRDYQSTSDQSLVWDFGDFDLGEDASGRGLQSDFYDFDDGYEFNRDFDFGDFN